MSSNPYQADTVDLVAGAKPSSAQQDFTMAPTSDTLWVKGHHGRIDRFDLQEILGQGGYAFVYKAHDLRLERLVALKVLKKDKATDQSKARFFREARTAAKLRHPRIVPVYDAGYDAEWGCWIAFQFVPGMTLSRYIIEVTLDAFKAATLIAELAGALHHCHVNKVMHRDLKPSNIVVDEEGHPWVIDFGLARWIDHHGDFTQDASILGSFGYMPPEIMRGNSKKADARADVYSLGVILFEIISRELPIKHPYGIPFSQMDTTIPAQPLRAIKKDAPIELERICKKALEVNPEDRYQTMLEFQLDLHNWIDSKQRIKPQRKPVSVAGLLLGGLIGFGAFGTLSLFYPNPAQPVTGQLSNPAVPEKIRFVDIPQQEQAPEPNSESLTGAESGELSASVEDHSEKHPELPASTVHEASLTKEITSSDPETRTAEVLGSGGQNNRDRDQQVIVVKNSDSYHTNLRCPSIEQSLEKNRQPMPLSQATQQNKKLCRNCRKYGDR